MSNLQSNDPSEILLKAVFGGDVISGFIRLMQGIEDESERINNRDALRTATQCMTRLFEEGRLSKANYLKALDALLEEKEKNVTIDAEISNRLNKLLK